jgi:hypothetical protein
MRRQVLWSALAVAAVTLLAGLVAGAAIRRSLIQESEAELLRQAEATATLITVAVRDAAPASDRANVVPIARTLEIARSIGGHDYVEARVVGLPAERAVIETPDTPLIDSFDGDPPVDRIIETRVDGDPVLAYTRWVAFSARSDARILIAIGRAEPLLAQNVLTRPLLFSLGVGAILAVILASWVARQVGRRLDRLGALRGRRQRRRVPGRDRVDP